MHAIRKEFRRLLRRKVVCPQDNVVCPLIDEAHVSARAAE